MDTLKIGDLWRCTQDLGTAAHNTRKGHLVSITEISTDRHKEIVFRNHSLTQDKIKNVPHDYFLANFKPANVEHPFEEGMTVQHNGNVQSMIGRHGTVESIRGDQVWGTTPAPIQVRWGDNELSHYSVGWANKNLIRLNDFVLNTEKFRAAVNRYQKVNEERAKYLFDDQYHQTPVTQEQHMKSRITTKHFYNGDDIAQMSEKEIIEEIDEMENEIANLKTINSKSKVIKRRAKQLKKDLIRLIKLTD